MSENIFKTEYQTATNKKITDILVIDNIILYICVCVYIMLSYRAYILSQLYYYAWKFLTENMPKIIQICLVKVMSTIFKFLFLEKYSDKYLETIFSKYKILVPNFRAKQGLERILISSGAKSFFTTSS